jgi:hypothetical protein
MTQALLKPPGRNGVLRALHRLAYGLAQRVMTLDVTEVYWIDLATAQMPVVEPRFEFRLLAADDVLHFARDPSNGLDPLLAQRAAGSRDYCLAALCGERLAAYGWFALGSIEAEHNRGEQPGTGVALSFPNDVAFGYGGFTHPDFRGHRLHAAVKLHGLRLLSDRGIRFLLTTTDWTNWAAIRSFDRLGAKRLGRCWRGGWGRWMFTRPPAAATRLGIAFGDAARVHTRYLTVSTSAPKHEIRNPKSETRTKYATTESI